MFSGLHPPAKATLNSPSVATSTPMPSLTISFINREEVKALEA